MREHQQGNCQALWAPFRRDLYLPFAICLRGGRSHGQYARDGHWNEREKLKYAVFIQHFRKLFEEDELKHAVRVYEMMADMIVTRDANQCRSHHQKMLKYRDCITNIIDSIAERYEPSLFHKIVAQYQVNIQSLIENGHRYIRNAWLRPKPRPTQRPAPAMRPSQTVSQKDSVVKSEVVDHTPLPSQQMKPQQQVCKQEEQGQKVKCINRPTADDYEQQQEEEEQQQQPQQKPQPQNHQIIFPIVYQLPCPIFTHVPMGEDERRQYRQRIQQMERKKIWHQENAELLYLQYQRENEAYKLCEVAISRWQSILKENMD